VKAEEGVKIGGEEKAQSSFQFFKLPVGRRRFIILSQF
jgi:hypothetical protein